MLKITLFNIQDPENHTLGRGGAGLIPALSPSEYVGTGYFVCIKFLFYMKTKGDFASILVGEGKYFGNISF